MLSIPFATAWTAVQDMHGIRFDVSHTDNIRLLVNGASASTFTEADNIEGKAVVVHDGSSGYNGMVQIVARLPAYGASISPPLIFSLAIQPVAETLAMLSNKGSVAQVVRLALGKDLFDCSDAVPPCVLLSGTEHK